MKRERVTINITVDLDPVPGWGHSAESWVEWLTATLNSMVGHYNPVVELRECKPDEHGFCVLHDFRNGESYYNNPWALVGATISVDGDWQGGGVLAWCHTEEEVQGLYNRVHGCKLLQDLGVEWFPDNIRQ